MITFFSIPRAFEGEFDELQRLAISSWQNAVPDAQIILMGSDDGVQEMAQELGLQHAPAIPRNSHGTPLLNGAFHLAESLSQFSLLCEISADIVLGGDVALALETVSTMRKPFIIGQRWDIDPGAEPDSAKLHPPSAADYFIYKKGTLGEIPPFAIGRTAYDNWLIWAAMEQWDLTVVDATEAITAIHVNHGYPAWKNGKGEMLQSQEREENHKLAKATGLTRWYNITDARFILKHGKVQEREKK